MQILCQEMKGWLKEGCLKEDYFKNNLNNEYKRELKGLGHCYRLAENRCTIMNI